MNLTFGYDGNLPNSEGWNFGGGVNASVSYQYNLNLWPTDQTVTPSSGSASGVTYAFDSDGLVTSATLAGGAVLKLVPNTTTSVLDSTRASGLAMRYGHNPYAELTSSAAWYGTDSLLTERYERDNLGRIARIVETTAAGTTDRGYHYDDRGRLESVRDSLAHVDIARYRYDANGNRLGLKTAADSVTAAYDEQDRLLDRGSAHYGYTASGERLTRTEAGATVGTTYDLLGNLVKVKLASGDSVEYVIDGRNRRVGRKLNGTLTARWVYANDLSVVGELDGAGALTKRFVYASHGHVPDLMVVRNPSGPDSTYRLVTDHLGSVRLVVNANTGFVAQRLAYDAWGVVTQDTRPGWQPFGYAGGLYDPSTALVRFGARDYDASAGVWTCKDPVGFGGGAVNLFVYSGDDPISQLDPRGTNVTVTVYEGAWGAGHIGIAVNSSATSGFYPDKQGWAAVAGGTPGTLRSDLQAPLEVVTIPTSSGQDRAISEYLAAHPTGTYAATLGGISCNGVVQRALQSGGIETYTPLVPKLFGLELALRYGADWPALRHIVRVLTAAKPSRPSSGGPL